MGVSTRCLRNSLMLYSIYPTMYTSCRSNSNRRAGESRLCKCICLCLCTSVNVTVSGYIHTHIGIHACLERGFLPLQADSGCGYFWGCGRAWRGMCGNSPPGMRTSRSWSLVQPGKGRIGRQQTQGGPRAKARGRACPAQHGMERPLTTRSPIIRTLESVLCTL